jgi:CBS domain containing-hemolysin-like protein
VAHSDSTLRKAADQMVESEIGRMPVVSRDNPDKVIGILTRSDVLAAHRYRLREAADAQRSIDIRKLRPGRGWHHTNGTNET